MLLCLQHFTELSSSKW